MRLGNSGFLVYFTISATRPLWSAIHVTEGLSTISLEASRTGSLAHFSVSKNVGVVHDIDNRAVATLVCPFKSFVECLLYVFCNVCQNSKRCIAEYARASEQQTYHFQ
jgi:hypothetical protein